MRRGVAVLLAIAMLTGLARSAEAAPAQVRLVSGEAEAGVLGFTLTLRLQLDGAAPFRVFTLDAPRRLIVDLEGAVAPEFAAAPVEAPAAVVAARSGPVRPGWSRLVLDLDRPLALASAELVGAPPMLEVRLRRASSRAFAAASGAPPGVWAPGGQADAAAAPDRAAATLTVAIDAGHGGVDPGAVHEGLQEKDLALAFSRDLAAAVAATGRLRAVLTRDSDAFLGLFERMDLARAAGADVFLSIHTNAAAAEFAGAIIFTRSETGSDGEAAARARLENRADTLGGLVATGPDDALRDALTGMALVETDARSALLAGALADALADTGTLAPFPRRSANFIVLGAHDMPSALLEIGFLSNAADRAAMTDPAWRARTAQAVAAGLERWLARDADLAARLRR